MLFKLSWQNMKKSIKDYAVYFFTLILGVAIFYVFNAIETQSAMLELSNYTEQIIKLLTNTLSGVSVFVAMVLGFLIIYASRFLIKRRNKEFGLYLLMGMGKRKVSIILFLETLLIGIISLGVGLLIGVAVSQFTSFFVAGMFAADMSRYQFVFSSDACVRTIIYFMIIYLVVILFNTFSINKCKLIDLFQGSKKTESVKLKNPWLCILVFLMAAGMLGYSYYHVTSGLPNVMTREQILIYIMLGSLGTFLVFWSLSGLLFKIVSSMKGIYFKGLNSFIFRQMSSRVNTNVCSMTIICLMLFITICVVASGLTVRNSMVANLNELAPADLNLMRRIMDEDVEGNEEQLSHKDLSILETYRELDCDLVPYFQEYLEFYTYVDLNCTFGHTLGSDLDRVRENFPFLDLDTLETIIKLSDYNRVAEFYGKETFSLEQDEYLIVADFDSMVELRNQVLAAGESLHLFGRELQPKYSTCQDGFVEMSSNHINCGIIVVPDVVVEEAAGKSNVEYEYVIANYNTNSREEIKKIEEKIQSIENYGDSYFLPQGMTRTVIAETGTGLGAVIAFVGLYVGLIMLISGAAILALKELSESTDNIERFRMLRKLGADGKLINRALFMQTALFFLFPLVLAGLHSVFGMIFSEHVMEVFGTEYMMISVFMTMGILVVIYGGYFLITYFSSKNIIKE